jgi:hypothetical protein
MATSIGESLASQAMNPERQPEAKRACRVLVVDDDDLVRAWLA